MKFTCTDCALKKVGCVTGEGLTPALIMIVSDRPTLDEVNNKTGFSGKSNEQINSYLTLAEIPLDKVYKTYIVKGYVKSGATVGIVSIRKCVPHLVEEIKLVKPKVIVLLGATAYKGFKGKSGSGTYYYDEEFSAWIVYSFHPMKPIYSGQEDDFMQIVSHFKLAKELVTRNTTQTLAKPNVVVVHTLEELQAVKSTLMVASECGIDCETTGLNLQKDKLLTIGFATKEFVIGVIYRKEMQQDLQDIFNVRKIIGHNLKFDIQVLRSNGLISKNVAADTMLEHYVLEPISTSRDLVSLCLKEFQTTFEKNLDYTTLFVNGITSEIENLLAERGALDAYLSFLLHEKFIARIQADKTMSSFFSNCVMPILDLLCEIEFNGIHIDQNELFSAETVLNYELKAREADILADPVVQHFAQKENLTEINLGSPKQMSTLIYKYLHFPVLREQGRTTAKDVIEKLNETQKNPFITKLLEYRNMSKLRDTYIKGLKEALDRSGEDRVHVQYNQTVVVTGRLSCFPSGTLVRKIVKRKKLGRGGKTSEYVPIESLQAGDLVYTHIGKAKKVTSTMRRHYKGDIIKMVLPWRGLPTIPRVIRVTPEHPFLTDMGWVKAKDITKDTVLYTYQDINEAYRNNMQHKRSGGTRPNSLRRYYGEDIDVHKRRKELSRRTYLEKYGKAAGEITRKCVAKMHAIITKGPIVRKSYHGAEKVRPGLLQKRGFTCEGCAISFLPKGLVVHHVDGNTLNNGEDNLKVLCYKCHNNIHKHPGTNKPQFNLNFSNVIKKNILMRDGHRCTRCGSGTNIMVHHISQTEGVTLCAKCHAQVHHGHPLETNGIQPMFVGVEQFEGMVYNLAVEEAESYFVQGVIAHNCSAPNLQTIPKAVENAKTIRKMFGARLGYSLVEMDFKQLEFRIWAHLSKDAAMLNMLEAGGDIHRNIAALLNGIAEPQVTDSQRYQAKEICFGLIYGMGVTTMSDRTGITVEEATRIKNDFFSTFPEATIWIKQVQDFGLKHKYVLTPFGRKIPIVYNPNDKEQIASAQRHAVNYPIQSTGGDLTNITGVYLKKLMITEGINAKIVLNVHDSLVWEVKDEEIVKFKPVALEAIKMISDKINFRAFLQASFTQGKNLGELVEL